MPLQFNKYEVPCEASEMGEHESAPLQSAMFRDQRSVQICREVAKLVKVRTARARSLRLVARRAAIRLLVGSVGGPMLLPLSGYESGVESEEDDSLRGRKRLSRPVDSEDEGSSEDEPLSCRVKRSVAPRICVPRVEVEEESDEDQQGSHFDSGSACGEALEEEEEEEEPSEEESSESDSDDDVIYMGCQSASTEALRQSLLPQFFSRS